LFSVKPVIGVSLLLIFPSKLPGSFVAKTDKEIIVKI